MGELQMQHVQHIGMHGHIKDFTANKEGKVIAIGKLLVGCIPKDTSTASLWAWVEEFVLLWSQVEGGQVYINLMYTHVLLNWLKNSRSVELHGILVEEVCSGNTAVMGADKLEATAEFQEGLLQVLEKKKMKKDAETDSSSLSEITADHPVLPELGAKVQTQVAESEDWSDVAIVVKVGDEEKKVQLKIVGTAGSKAFTSAHWAPMQPPLMRMAPAPLKADAKDGGSEGVTVDDYSGKEKLKAAKSLTVDLDVEARLNRYQWAGVHTTAKAEHLCP